MSMETRSTLSTCGDLHEELRSELADPIVSAHQPNYLPWIGYFHKLYHSDVFVLLDDVEFSSGSWTNRNQIKTPDGWSWLTVPVRQSTGPVSDVTIDCSQPWQTTHLKSIQHNYGKAQHYDEHIDLFADIYNRDWESLCELNVRLIRELSERIGIECRLVRSSSLGVTSTKTERIVDICDRIGAGTYLSGTGATDYTDESLFDQNDITLEYQSIEFPEYEQRFEGFVPKLSIVDALFNIGADRTQERIRTM